ncbi:MAG: hypothetical protein GDA39_04740, partial [Hyphomonadaceae bacterium]|nr:hypothetical protein [Hyphomonadaceae bacterium]
MLYNVCVVVSGVAIGLIRYMVLGSVLLAAPGAFGRQLPGMSFSPDRIEVKSGETVPVKFTVPDGIDKSVKCREGSFDVENNTYTAPTTDYDSRGYCWALVVHPNFDDYYKAVLRISVIGVDVNPPVVVFKSNEVEVRSGDDVYVRYSIFDANHKSSGVTCDKGVFY